MADNFVTIASFAAKALAPRAIVTVSTAGIATGMAEIVRIREKMSKSNNGSCLIIPTYMITPIRTSVIRIKKFPTFIIIA